MKYLLLEVPDTFPKCPAYHGYDKHRKAVAKRKAKTVTIAGVVALNRDGEVYAIRINVDSDHWDKNVWRKAKITYTPPSKGERK